MKLRFIVIVVAADIAAVIVVAADDITTVIVVAAADIAAVVVIELFSHRESKNGYRLSSYKSLTVFALAEGKCNR